MKMPGIVPWFFYTKNRVKMGSFEGSTSLHTILKNAKSS